MHRSCPSLVGTTMKLTPKRQCSLLTTITTQTQSWVLQRTLPSPQQTRPCITSPVSCDTGGGGSSCLRERAPQPPVHQSLQSSTAEREDLCLYTAVRYTQTYIPARTQVPRNTCRNTPGKCFPALPVLARSSQTTKHTHNHTHRSTEQGGAWCHLSAHYENTI